MPKMTSAMYTMMPMVIHVAAEDGIDAGGAVRSHRQLVEGMTPRARVMCGIPLPPRESSPHRQAPAQANGKVVRPRTVCTINQSDGRVALRTRL